MKIQAKITYSGKLDSKIDRIITDEMESAGFVWYAQGYDIESNIRDIVFDKEISADDYPNPEE